MSNSTGPNMTITENPFLCRLREPKLRWNRKSIAFEKQYRRLE